MSKSASEFEDEVLGGDIVQPLASGVVNERISIDIHRLLSLQSHAISDQGSVIKAKRFVSSV
jgi:hypothetical protein